LILLRSWLLILKPHTHDNTETNQLSG
jgi:hypothetical protein